jgi:3-methylcrotonyl-CoA carboxylase alpha subunit
MITGLDLVEWQLRVAAGEPLPLKQSEIAQRGHAIQVRLYAEVPENGFLPSSGTVRRFELPPTGAEVRVDSGIELGDTVGIDYDPMLAKLIVHGGTRAEAVASLQRALSEVRIEGVGHNVAFLERLTSAPQFVQGSIDIGFIERSPVIVRGSSTAPDRRALAAAALWIVAHEGAPEAPRAADAVWGKRDGWRLNASRVRVLQFQAGSEAPWMSVALQYAPDGLRLRTDDADFIPAALLPQTRGTYFLQLGSEGTRLQLQNDANQLRIRIGPSEFTLRWLDPRTPQISGHTADASLAAPMPGRIIAHLVAAGVAVTRGTPLLIMEAMKMEHTLCAPADGTVRVYLAAVGQQVREGTELVDFEAAQR